MEETQLKNSTQTAQIKDPNQIKEGLKKMDE
jgi:hypothetical protein